MELKDCVEITAFNVHGQQANQQIVSMNYQTGMIESSRYWLDVDYVGDASIAHKLDIHLPKKRKGPFPVVISIYGSAFQSNSSKSNTFRDGLGQALLAGGFAVVTVNHRSSFEAIFPAQIQDIKSAIRFIRANATSFNLNTTKIGLTGWSSGGHLSALAGTTGAKSSGSLNHAQVDLVGKETKNIEQSDTVQAVVDWYGPTEFLSMDSCGNTPQNHDSEKSAESILIGGKIQENKDKTTLANPMFYISETTPPFLIIHGEKDSFVPICQSEKLHQALIDKGIKSTLIRIPEGTHGPKVMIPENYARMVRFFHEYIC